MIPPCRSTDDEDGSPFHIIDETYVTLDFLSVYASDNRGETISAVVAWFQSDTSGVTDALLASWSARQAAKADRCAALWSLDHEEPIPDDLDD